VALSISAMQFKINFMASFAGGSVVMSWKLATP